MPIQKSLCISTTISPTPPPPPPPPHPHPHPTNNDDTSSLSSATTNSLDKLAITTNSPISHIPSPSLKPLHPNLSLCQNNSNNNFINNNNNNPSFNPSIPLPSFNLPKPFCMKTHLLSLLNLPLPTQFSSSVLHPDAVFSGIQYSNHNEYSVTVRLINVDLGHSHLSAFLDINGLTPAQSDITTYLEAEIIGPEHSFYTRKWDANDEVDQEHWTKFPEYGTNYVQSDVLFMRWKELFLVPNHKQKSIDGASFSGFYYVAMNLRLGSIVGYYYSKNSEWFQRLELQYCPPHSSSSFDFC